MLHVGARGVVHVRVGDHVRDGEASPRPQYARGLADHAALVGAEVDHAVGDDDVDAGVRERDLLDVALEELDVLDARRARVGTRQREHLVGHVEPDRLAGRARRGGGDQDVGAGARAEVEHRLALVQIGDGGGDAAAERGVDDRFGRALRVAGAVERAAEDLLAVAFAVSRTRCAASDDPHPRCAATASRARRSAFAVALAAAA